MDSDMKIPNSPNKSKEVMGVQEGIVISTEMAIEARVLSMAEKETIDSLKRLKSCFPYSLDSNTLLSNMCWEYSSAWINCVADIRPLNAALNVAEKIPCPHTRQGKYFEYLDYYIVIYLISIFNFRYLLFGMVYTFIPYFPISCETY